MRTLVIALACGALVGCGGLDESTLPDDTASTQAALERETLPEQEVIWAVVWSAASNELLLMPVPVEERFFYRVDVNAPPPQLPPEPCPVCR